MIKLLGQPIADEIKADLMKRSKPEGVLAVVQIGDDPVSSLYIKKKQEFAKEVGVKLEVISSTAESAKLDVENLATRGDIKGIIIQLPIPASIDREEILRLIPKEKDVDGFRYIIGDDYISTPPTVLAIDEVFKHYDISLESGVLIVGGGFLVGKPLYKFLKEKGISVFELGKGDDDYEQTLKSHKVVVVATGGGRYFEQSEFQENSYVIDASTVQEENKIRGDVSAEGNLINLCPVPGGVGPITVSMLFKNFFDL